MKKKTDRLIRKQQIKEAVKALKEFQNKWEEANASRKKQLLEESSQSPILLNFTLKKIPESSSIQMIKVPLPHTLVTDVTEVCLITGDLDKKDTKADIEPTVQHYKELLSKHGVKTVTEVIPLRQLRTEYKPYEARRNLYGAYDIFLADNKINQCLPRVLGKFFFKKRKFPQQINLATSNLKSQIDNALSRTVFFLTGRGNTCSAQVAHLGFTTRQIVENIEAAINKLADDIPGAWKNINGLYIKTPLSVSIPLYMSLESGNEVELPSPEAAEDVEAEELTTLKGYKVKVFPDGNVEVLKMDESLSENDSDQDYVETVLGKRKMMKRKDDNVGKSRKMLKKQKIENNETHTEQSRTVPQSNKKFKKKVIAKPENVLRKKQKLSVDEVDSEVKIALRKKKKLRVVK